MFAKHTFKQKKFFIKKVENQTRPYASNLNLTYSSWLEIVGLTINRTKNTSLTKKNKPKPKLKSKLDHTCKKKKKHKKTNFFDQNESNAQNSKTTQEHKDHSKQT
jgi:hypothetical protein